MSADRLLKTSDVNDQPVTIDTKLRLKGHLTDTKPNVFGYKYFFGLVNVPVGSTIHQVKVFMARENTNMPLNRKLKIDDKMQISCDVYSTLNNKKQRPFPTAKNVIFPVWVVNQAIGRHFESSNSQNTKNAGNGDKNEEEEEAINFLISGTKSLGSIGDFEPLDGTKKQTSADDLCKTFVENVADLLKQSGSDITFDGSKQSEMLFKSNYNNLAQVESNSLDLLMYKLKCDSISGLFENKNVETALKHNSKVKTKVEFQENGNVLIVYAVKSVGNFLKHGFK